jgi:cytochrome c553
MHADQSTKQAAGVSLLASCGMCHLSTDNKVKQVENRSLLI